jgi:hypothetical protein
MSDQINSIPKDVVSTMVTDLFRASSAAMFELVGAQTLDNGIAILSYRFQRS